MLDFFIIITKEKGMISLNQLVMPFSFFVLNQISLRVMQLYSSGIAFLSDAGLFETISV
jgi:hypothetical protein